MLIIPVGLPGCGKSTLAYELVGDGIIHFDAVVSPDRYREILTGDKHNQDVNREAWSFANRIAVTRLGYSQDVYLDATNLVRSWYKDLLTAAETYDHNIAYVWFDNAAQAIERNKKRDIPVPPDAMRKMTERWKSVDFTDAFTGTGNTVKVFFHDSDTLFEDLNEHRSREFTRRLDRI